MKNNGEKTMKNTINLMILIGAVTVTVISAEQSTEHPTTVSVQGVLRDNDGRSLADEDYDMTFEIYGNENGTGIALWDEEVTLTVVNGVWSHTLGLVSDNPLTGLDSDGTNYLKITVGTDALAPLTLLSLNPYETLNVTSGGNKIPATGDVGIGTNSPTKKLDVRGDIRLDGDLRMHSGGYIYMKNNKMIKAENSSGTDVHGIMLRSSSNQMKVYIGEGGFEIRNDSDPYTTRFEVTDDGRVGIGTGSTAPTADKLNVKGDVKLMPGSASPKIADTFAGNTNKSKINFEMATGSNDPGAIIHETRGSGGSAETNRGVLHLMPSDDNSYGDYVSIHGTNDPDKIKLHTSGKIEGVTDMDMSGDLAVGGEITASNITEKQTVFRITTGNNYINTTSWTNMTNGSDMSGMATINGPFCYALQTDGLWVDGNAHRIYLRIRFYSSGTSNLYYYPDTDGHMNHYYVNDSRLQSWTNTFCVDDLPAGYYLVTLQWKGENTQNTRWNSTYGHIALSIW